MKTFNFLHLFFPPKKVKEVEAIAANVRGEREILVLAQMQTSPVSWVY